MSITAVRMHNSTAEWNQSERRLAPARNKRHWSTTLHAFRPRKQTTDSHAGLCWWLRVSQKCETQPLKHSLIIWIWLYYRWTVHINTLKGMEEADTDAAAAKLRQSCPTRCDPIDGSPPGSPVPGICQARGLEWEADTSRFETHACNLLFSC